MSGISRPVGTSRIPQQHQGWQPIVEDLSGEHDAAKIRLGTIIAFSKDEWSRLVDKVCIQSVEDITFDQSVQVGGIWDKRESENASKRIATVCWHRYRESISID